MIWFADTDRTVIGEVYEQMDNMLGQIKDIVEPKDAILYDHIHKLVVKRWDNLNVPLHALAYVLTPKYYSSSWLAQPAPGGGERRKPHTDPEVQNGYMLALDKLVPDEEECAQVRTELSKYISEPESLVTCMQPKIETGWVLSNGGTCMAPLPKIFINWR